jgi:hypothetical protein
MMVLLQHITEEYNGTTWTAGPGNLNTARSRLAGAGTQTAALAFGGIIPTNYRLQQKNMMEQVGQHNPKFKTARIALGGAGTNSAGLAFGGIISGTYTAATEEWTGAGTPTTVTITAS